MSAVMGQIEVDLRRKAGSISKSGRPEGSRLEREVYSGTVLKSGEPEDAWCSCSRTQEDLNPLPSCMVYGRSDCAERCM